MLAWADSSGGELFNTGLYLQTYTVAHCTEKAYSPNITVIFFQLGSYL